MIRTFFLVALGVSIALPAQASWVRPQPAPAPAPAPKAPEAPKAPAAPKAPTTPAASEKSNGKSEIRVVTKKGKATVKSAKKHDVDFNTKTKKHKKGKLTVAVRTQSTVACQHTKKKSIGPKGC